MLSPTEEDLLENGDVVPCILNHGAWCRYAIGFPFSPLHYGQKTALSTE